MTFLGVTHISLVVIGVSGLALNSSGALFVGVRDDNGYPIAIIALIVHLIINFFELIFKNKNQINNNSLKILLILIGLQASILLVGLIGLFEYNQFDILTVALHSIWIWCVVNGVLCAINKRIKNYILGINLGFLFVVSYISFDIILEFFECGVLLCGYGRMSPQYGVPGLYQEYIYIPVLLLGLLAMKAQLDSRFVFPLAMLVGIIIILTGSREGILSWFCFCVLLYLFSKNNLLEFYFKLLKTFLFLLCLIFITVYVVYLEAINFAIFQKMLNLSYEFTREGHRIDIFKDYLEFIAFNFMIGSGFIDPAELPFSVGVEHVSAHNSYLDLAANGGLFILFYFLFIVCLLFIGIGKKYGYASPIFLFIFVFLVLSMNINTPHRSVILSFIPFGLIGLLFAAKKSEIIIVAPEKSPTP